MPDSLTPTAAVPVNIEPPVSALDSPITPTHLFFTRNNGTVPAAGPDWTLSVTGMVQQPLTLTPEALRARFPIVEVVAVMECAGNNRSAITPVNRRPKRTPHRRPKGTPVPAFIAPRCRPARSRRRSGGRHRGAALRHTRFLNRQLSLPVSTMSQ